ncbi:sugar-transfer associated ATP-grasp domain-containing protein [Peribacillus frigoritolerans]|uniref:sugar-transfer associated ATP-grasp domain-containing protein n=1 Tax=Peribacillus frigoritolerans TaxID=450367 RepID=UPI00203A8B42|nr:sugar-transfer associated ATP-grasp domain-containing protein [Peribacillus frigoritolerans]
MMRIYTKLELLFDFILRVILKTLVYVHELKNIRRKKNLFSNVELKKEQEQEIDALWIKNYGKKYSTKWHRLYQSYSGNYDANYFPEILFSTKLEPMLNPRYICRALSDKAITEILINDGRVKCPKTFALNANGFYYDSERIVINKERFMSIVQNIGDSVIKPTINTSSGRGVRILNIKNGVDLITGDDITTIIKKYKSNFIIQEKLVAHPSYSQLHESSINTLRVITYILDGKVHCAPLSLRIGMNGSFVDNAHAGGIAIGVTNNGKLKKTAFTEMQEAYTVHPDSGIVFEDYQVAKTQEIVGAAKRLHGHLPNLGIISWDFMLESDESIVLIEINITSQSIWFPQFANGCGIFGENTEKMIRMASRKK